MTNLLLLLDFVLVAILSPWFGLMALIILAATWRRFFGGHPALESKPTSRFLFVIPAHDEADVIGITVRSCLAVDYDPDMFQVYVIADNCSDDTASIAEAAGARVMVRHDLARKSKGFALEDFFGGVPTNPEVRPFDAYVLVDADTSVGVDLLRAFDRSLQKGDDFIQGYYTVRNADASWRTRLMTYAFSLANGVWLLGLDQLGLSVGLKGNGMCFRRTALERFPWQAHGLVEDMEFAWNLRLGGERVQFEPKAQVYGEMVSRGGSGATSQRRRWESGRKALRASFRHGLWVTPRLSPVHKAVYQLDLDFPPLSRLLIGLSAASAIAGLSLALGGIDSYPSFGVATFFFVFWGIFFAYALSPLFTISLPIRYLLSLGHLPYYIIWKTTIGLLKMPQGWVRTPREASSATPPKR